MGKSVTEILASMSLEDKVALLSGADFWHLKSKPRLGIPQVMVSDGPHGLRKQAGASDHLGMGASIPATCFPTASALASSWNRNLLRVMGEALGEECLQEEVAVLLGPGVNIKRSPLCGRNFEYFSEDPCLAGELAAAWIQGVQAMGVGASLKHFACNNQEELRMTIEAVVDQRSLRELYLPAFETAIKKASPWTVMAAYNRLNGAFCAEQPWLLGDLLRNDWGFEGVVVTDWGACNDRFQGLVAGLDLEMPYPGPHNDRETWRELLRDPRRIEILDRTVARLLSLILKADANRRPGFRYDAEAHHALARRTAAESMVLLKNQGGLLPLAEGTKLAVIGDFAQKPRYQGAGSSLINPTRLDTVLSLIAGYTGEVSFSRGYDQATDRVDEALVAEAALAAREADVALVFVGLTAAYEMEGADRRHLRLPESHDRLVEAVAAANPKTIVVLSNGSAVELPWLEKVAAVLEAFLAGQAGAGAALDILFGRVCPSGKLAETWPLDLGDLASSSYFPEGPLTVEYREGPYVGYRFFDASGKEPLFPFGFGLSYTSFAY
jgi:beta-glucosidase